MTARLFERWRQDGDARARDELVRRHLPLARRLAGRYRNGLEPFEDLFQVASLGLVVAIERFDPGRGLPFPSYAIPTILGELKRHFRDTGWSAHVPRPAKELAQQIDSATRELTPRLQRPPRVDELTHYLEISTEDILTGLHAAAAHHSTSLDTPVLTEAGEPVSSVGDSFGAEDHRYELVETAAALPDGLQRLLLNERRAVTLRLAHDFTQSEIAERLGCSQMQVSRLLRSAAQKLRDLGVI